MGQLKSKLSTDELKRFSRSKRSKSPLNFNLDYKRLKNKLIFEGIKKQASQKSIEKYISTGSISSMLKASTKNRSRSKSIKGKTPDIVIFN